MLRVSEQGEMLQLLADPDGQRVANISSATEGHGGLFFGSVKEDYVSFYAAPDLVAAQPAQAAGAV